jgi:hypothetical protein
MLAVALFVDRHIKKEMTETQCHSIEEKWLARRKDKVGVTRTPRQVMRAYCNHHDITPDNLDLAMDWDCWPEGGDLSDDE